MWVKGACVFCLLDGRMKLGSVLEQIVDVSVYIKLLHSDLMRYESLIKVVNNRSLMRYDSLSKVVNIRSLRGIWLMC